MIVIFKDKALFDQIAEEVTVTESGVWTYQGDRYVKNAYQPCMGADGRCAMCHNFSEEDEAFLRTYCEGLDVQFLEGDALPGDWVYPEVVTP